MSAGKFLCGRAIPTFFFYNMEWRSLIQGQVLNQTVPLTSTYGGNFGSTGDQCSDRPVSPDILAKYAADGLTPGQPFPNNTIPADLLDPNAQALLAAGIFPAPTSGTQFIGGNNVPTNVREEVVRVDHQFTDKFSIFGHWVSEQINQSFGTAMWSDDNLPTASNTFGNPSYSGVVHTTYAISPRLLNEVAFNYNANRIAIIPKGVVDTSFRLHHTPAVFGSEQPGPYPGN